MTKSKFEKLRNNSINYIIADKILPRLHDLEKDVELNKGRWIWELLQNAKDTISEDDNRKISVQVLLKKESVEFRHNGDFFSEDDILGLLNQITSKEPESGKKSKKTGRFGTGFLTTHLLSRIVEVKGIHQDEYHNYFTFKVQLDREGKMTKDLVPKIDKAWEDLQNSLVQIENFDEKDFNTSFRYSLGTEQQLTIASIGVSEFLNLIPFVISTVNNINQVEIFDEINNKKTVFSNYDKKINNSIIPITKSVDGSKSKIYMLSIESEKAKIICELEKKGENFYIKPLDGIPRIFCDFPLIGTEKFFFPVIINSFELIPTRERNGIRLFASSLNVDNEEIYNNREILIEAVNLYKVLIGYLEENPFGEIYNIAQSKNPELNELNFDISWYKTNVQGPIRDILKQAKIINHYLDEKTSLDKMWFPRKSYSDKVKEKIWKIYTNLYPTNICKFDELYEWTNIIWEGWVQFLDYAELMKDIDETKSIEVLSSKIEKDEQNTFLWLNDVCNFVLEDEKNLSLFNNFAVIPNQNMLFKTFLDLYTDEINEDDLLEIMELLGEDWKEYLVHR